YTTVRFSCLFTSYGPHRYLHSFPTRRSSDLVEPAFETGRRNLQRIREMDEIFHVEHSAEMIAHIRAIFVRNTAGLINEHAHCRVDRKSTRLNSSHVAISYAVFCLKKKTNK